MSVLHRDNLLQAIPIRFRPINVPSKEQLDGFSTDYMNGQFERIFCMNRRDELRDAIKETLADFVSTRAKDADGTALDDALQSFELDEKAVSDMMFSFLSVDGEAENPNE